MTELKKLIEAAKAVATSCQFHHYSLLADVDALRAAIPAAELYAERMGECEKVLQAVLDCEMGHDERGHAFLKVPARSLNDLGAIIRALLVSLDAEVGKDAGGWVSVSEPPTEEGWYIVAVRTEPRSRLGYWHKASQGWSADYKTVTHWQPLPAPPSEPEEKL